MGSPKGRPWSTWPNGYIPQTSQEKYRISRVKYQLVSVRVEIEQAEALKVLSKKTGKRQAELIRTYIEWGLENDGG